jgi:hypothetical protein
MSRQRQHKALLLKKQKEQFLSVIIGARAGQRLVDA